MRHSISIRSSVRPSVHPSVTLEWKIAKNVGNQLKTYFVHHWLYSSFHLLKKSATIVLVMSYWCLALLEDEISNLLFCVISTSSIFLQFQKWCFYFLIVICICKWFNSQWPDCTHFVYFVLFHEKNTYLLFSFSWIRVIFS